MALHGQKHLVQMPSPDTPAPQISPHTPGWPHLSLPELLPQAGRQHHSKAHLSSVCLCLPAPLPRMPAPWGAPSHLAVQGSALCPFLPQTLPDPSKQDWPLPPCAHGPHTHFWSVTNNGRAQSPGYHETHNSKKQNKQIRMLLYVVKFYFLK